MRPVWFDSSAVSARHRRRSTVHDRASTQPRLCMRCGAGADGNRKDEMPESVVLGYCVMRRSLVDVGCTTNRDKGVMQWLQPVPKPRNDHPASITRSAVVPLQTAWTLKDGCVMS